MHFKFCTQTDYVLFLHSDQKVTSKDLIGNATPFLMLGPSVSLVQLLEISRSYSV